MTEAPMNATHAPDRHWKAMGLVLRRDLLPLRRPVRAAADCPFPAVILGRSDHPLPAQHPGTDHHQN